MAAGLVAVGVAGGVQPTGGHVLPVTVTVLAELQPVAELVTVTV